MENIAPHQPVVDFIDDPLYPANVDQLDSIYTVLEGVEFPIRREHLIQHYGNRHIFWSQDCTVTLAEILRQTPQAEFASLSDLSDALSKLPPEP